VDSERGQVTIQPTLVRSALDIVVHRARLLHMGTREVGIEACGADDHGAPCSLADGHYGDCRYYPAPEKAVVECGECGGDGYVTVSDEVAARAPGVTHEEPCALCRGSGRATCSFCHARTATTLLEEDGDAPWCDECLAECA
jgi:hypothetical protein